MAEVSLLRKLKQLVRPLPLQAGASDLLNRASFLQTTEERVEWFESLVTWLKKDSGTPGRYVRFKFLFQLLESKPEWKLAFVAQIRVLMRETSLLRLFLQTGYSEQQGLLQEVGRRLLTRVLPVVHENNFFEIARDLFKSDDELVWLINLPTEVLEQIQALFELTLRAEIADMIKRNADEAILVFSARLTEFGLTTEIRTRLPQGLPSQSPFLKLQRALELKAATDSDFEACRRAIAVVYEDMERNGTSVGLVYRLEVMTAILQRLKLLAGLIGELEISDWKAAFHRIIADAVEATVASRSIVGHLHQQTHLLSRKIAERNGESGDHYIARTGSDRFYLFGSALKGGVIVLLMTTVKLSLHFVHLPALLQAFVVWCVYTSGFLLMQFTGSTLATKLPSFTATKLARLMNQVRRMEDLDLLVTETKQVVSSQIVAFLGNLFSLIPLAMALEYALGHFFNWHLLDEAYATQTLKELHPLLSLAIPFGAMTGVLLWLSSLAGGWFENWIVYRQIPRAIREHRRLRKIFGADVPVKVGDWLQHQASGISANVTLGFLFGFVPFLGVITGVPLDSKHVTISSASAILAAFSLPLEVAESSLLGMAIVGLVFIGVMNLAVSFALALIVAARASAISPRRFRVLTKLIFKRVLIFWR